MLRKEVVNVESRTGCDSWLISPGDVGYLRTFTRLKPWQTPHTGALASPNPLGAKTWSVLALFFRFQPGSSARQRDGSVPSGLQTRLWPLLPGAWLNLQEAIAARAQAGKFTFDKSLNKEETCSFRARRQSGCLSWTRATAIGHLRGGFISWVLLFGGEFQSPQELQGSQRH